MSRADFVPLGVTDGEAPFDKDEVGDAVAVEERVGETDHAVDRSAKLVGCRREDEVLELVETLNLLRDFLLLLELGACGAKGKLAALVGVTSQAAHALARWEHIDLAAEVQRLTDLPVVFAKDTTAACVAELLQGQGRNVRSFLYVFVGTFVGGGLVLSGHIVNGQRGNAGAIGSLPVGLAKPDAKSKGSDMPPQLLQTASGWQLEQALLAAGHDPLLIHQDDIMEEAYAAFTGPWIAQASQALAMTAASSAALLDLDAVVMDGSLGAPLMAALMAATQEALSGYRFDGMHQPPLLTGQVGAHARALGGALLPLHSQFFPDKDIFLKQDAP
jgi:predicted NBD/HSP70 family sugar kinase